jgi:tetratricopeptide (TPR) repeat protein
MTASAVLPTALGRNPDPEALLMPNPFLNSEEYDERAHKQYDRGDYDAALETLQEGLRLYPHSVDLFVGLGYTRLAREEFVWAKQAFEKALVLDPEHDDARVGLGEALLRFGRRDQALTLFEKVRSGPGREDGELLLAMGRALYREERYLEARASFEDAIDADPDDVEAIAALGYTLHRLGEEEAAVDELQRALEMSPGYHEARIYLGHLLYDRGDWSDALAHFAALAPADHWDSLAVWRLMELKQAVGGLTSTDPELVVWEGRLDELEPDLDPTDELLAEIELGVGPDEGSGWADLREAPHDTGRPGEATHLVRLPDGSAFEGSWLDIVRQLRDRAGRSGESVAQFMRRWAQDNRVRIGAAGVDDDAESFLLAHARAGLLHIER